MHQSANSAAFAAFADHARGASLLRRSLRRRNQLVAARLRRR